MKNKFGIFWSEFNKFNTSDPDDARRGQLLNILLAGTFVLSFLTLTITLFLLLVSPPPPEDLVDVLLIVYGATAFIFGAAGLFWINKRSRRLAALLLLLLLSVVFIFSDTPTELTIGRSSFVFLIPIAISSLLLAPASSFLFAIFNGLIVTGLALNANVFPNVTAIFGFFMVAIISWLSARGLENALRDLRNINAELDQRVSDRTRELSESLSRESEQASQRQAILQGIADGVIVFDNTGKAILANPALTRLIDIPLDQIISHTTNDIFEASEITHEDRGTLLGILSTTNSSPVPMRIRMGPKTLSVNAAPVMDLKNKFIGHVAVFRDFTREAEVEEMKNSFVAMVSHELRTPLNAILGYSEMLREAYYGPLNEKQTNAADRILNNSRRLLDIVSDLLDKAQIEAGHLNLKISTFPTQNLAENLHSVMDKITGDRGLWLTSEISPDMPEQLTGDPERIQQIMVNLVNNAAKFTEKGGIAVKIYKVANEYWACDVTDTGPGIAPEDQRYIFEPFRQVDKTVTRSKGGIGLGLSIVKRLVDLMGGRIFLKSVVGQGSTFTVVLPFEPQQKGK
jgi:signal transduction histidine kinase